MSAQDTMVELTVVFENQSIANAVWTTGPYNEDVDGAWSLLDVTTTLKQTAIDELGADIKDEQCFYRLFRR